MQIFELHFNPRKQEHKIIESFIYEPGNVYEKRLGNLYMAGELTQALPQNARFFNNLASVIKKEYYGAGFKKSCQQSLQNSLKKANEFLDEDVQKGNVSWLGNLNFGILSFSNFILNFTKIGKIEIFLIRKGQILNISQNLESQEEIHPLKIFSNIVTGKLVQDDKIIVLNKDIFNILSQNKDFLNQLGQMSDEKGVREILKRNKQIFSDISGICLLIMVNENAASKQILTFDKNLPKFSFQKTFIKPIYKLKLSVKSIKVPFFKLPSLTFPKVHLPKIKLPKIRIAKHKKKIILVISLILILLAFFFLFSEERKKELKEAQEKILQAQSNIIMAENLLILEEKDKAKNLFQEAWDLIHPLTKAGRPLRSEALLIKESLEEYLK